MEQRTHELEGSIKESCYTYERVMSRILTWQSVGDVEQRTRELDKCDWHYLFCVEAQWYQCMNERRSHVTLTHTRHKHHIHSFIPVSELPHKSYVYMYVCVAWLIHVRDMTHLYTYHNSATHAIITSHVVNVHWERVYMCVCVAWLIHVRDMTRLYMYHNSATHAINTSHVVNVHWERVVSHV